MTDTDQISKLLVTLEPLASSLHFCIIGEERRGEEGTIREEKRMVHKCRMEMCGVVVTIIRMSVWLVTARSFFVMGQRQ